MNPRKPVQMRLVLEINGLWDRFPREIQEPCIDLASQMLKAVLQAESKLKEESDEREADGSSS